MADIREGLALLKQPNVNRMFVAYLVSYTGNAMAPIAMAFGVLDLTGRAEQAAAEAEEAERREAEAEEALRWRCWLLRVWCSTVSLRFDMPDEGAGTVCCIGIEVDMSPSSKSSTDKATALSRLELPW